MTYIILILFVFVLAGCAHAKPVDIHTWRKNQYRKKIKTKLKNYE